jgi:hypothetical protein
VFWSQRRLWPGQLAFVPGHALVGVGVAITSSCIFILLGDRHRGAWDRRLRHWNQVSFWITADLAYSDAECDL